MSVWISCENGRVRLEGAGLTLYSLEPGISDGRGRLLQSYGLFVRSAVLG